MRLRVMIPSQVLLDQPVRKVVAEAPNGHFGLLPRHIDFVTVLVPGLLAYFDDRGCEHFIATDEGVLVKCGREVTVATRSAVKGGDLGELRMIVEREFRTLDEQERVARSAMARLEAGLVRRFLDFDSP
ncbi:MAG: F0F1 ATP synthase subunit epsilon [Planctomycetota bacterium]|nr:MAG: F0F1 ATP synthase subunit epsilon [Planctomycetota bacterium]